VVTDPTRICELLVGLPDVRILGVEHLAGGPLTVSIEQAADRPACMGCGRALLYAGNPNWDLLAHHHTPLNSEDPVIRDCR
jgi:hypothetical protein